MIPTSQSGDSTPHNNYYIPTVIESDGRGERAFDIYSRLLKDRIIFIGTGIDDGVARLLRVDPLGGASDRHATLISPPW